MASGGYRPNKSGRSEPKRRSNWQQSVSSDRDDAQSLNSLHSDMRINNWDLSDLCPSNLGGDSKRRKKSKGNPEREREQSLSLDSPPHDKKHYKTSSFPHSKITSSALTSQRVALENLKQHMTFSDMDDQISTDGERNNERQISQAQSGRRLQHASFNRPDSEDDVRGTRDRYINRNNNMDYSSREHGPDSNEIVAHLMQIRDFTKQARSMLESMEKLGDRKKAEDIEKVRRLIINLQEQEQGYRGLLQNTMTHHDDDDGDEAAGGEDDRVMKVDVKYDSDDDLSVDLEVRTEESETTENSQDSRPRIESKLGIESDDDDAEGEENQYVVPVRGAVGKSSEKANSSRATEIENTLIQGQLGLPGVPVKESVEGSRGLVARDGEPTVSDHQELIHILREKQHQLKALMNRQEELNLKRRETEKKLFEAQTRDNKARAALVAVSTGRQIMEHRLATHQALMQDVGAAAWESRDEDESEAVGEDRQLKSNIVGYPESDDEDNSKVCEVESLPNELLELKRQLNYLRNEFSQVSEAPKNVESEACPMAEGRDQLQNKIQELQDKKSHMDLLLQELQRLHSQPLDNLRNNETNSHDSSVQPSSAVASSVPTTRQQSQQKRSSKTGLPSASSKTRQSSNHQAMMNEMTSTPSGVDNVVTSLAHMARETACEQEPGTVDPGMVQDMQDKLRHLKEVRSQLDQLRSLVQYYQGQKNESEATADMVSTTELPGYNDSALHTQASAEVRGSQSSLQQQQVQDLLWLHTHRDQRQGKEGGANAATSLHNMVQLPNLAATDQGGELSDEDNASVSHTDSQWSHLGPWDDDPEIQEKVRKLRAAKEKLRQLQDLVAFVQQSPDNAGALPENVGDLAASVEGEAVSHATQTDDLNVSVSEGEVTSEALRVQPKEELNGIENPRAELLRLRKERSMLLEIQNQLKNMHNQSSSAQGEEIQERTEPNSDIGKSGLEQVPSATVVTFASNDELYSKMRRQRILREELRSKKKELEAIMKKDRNKRQYSRNQDNQSDTVSLNTDAFGIAASVDATMATWGGSTVDNLENITEDEDGQERSDHINNNEDDEDDGYPSDGIAQVEEEEEENNSDDGTYTIERDARQRKNMRKGANMDLGARPKTSRGRQTYPQPTYRDKNMKKSAKKDSSNRSSQNQRDGRPRQEDFVPSLEQRQEEKAFRGQSYEWFRSIEDKLSTLSNAVETLLTKSETEGRQLSVSLSQENTLQSGRLMSPMQEQMIQLQNQSMMLSFGQLVQSLTHQQGDIQQLQQQMQALQLQVQDLHHEHSFPVGSTTGVVHPHLLHSALSNPALNTSNYNLQSGPVSSHTLTFTQPQIPSPFAQSNLNATAPSGIFGELSAVSPSLRSFQPNSLGISASNLSLGLERRATGGASGLGASLSVNTGSNLSLPQQGSGFTFNHVGQSTSNLLHSHHQASQTSSSAATLTKDFSQFVDTLQSAPSTSDNIYGDFSHLFGSANQQQPNLTSRMPFLSTQVMDNEDMESENSLPRRNAHLTDTRNKNRKHGLKVKKSESDPTSGVKMSTPKVESFQGRNSGGNNDLPRWEVGNTTDYRTLSGGAGFDGAASFTGGTANFNEDARYSNIQFIQDKHSRLRRDQTQAKSTSGVAESDTLFDALRDTIYTEVASVISQNENRPHFLLELFRDMRQINSDFMRQRALYSMQDILRSNLKGTGTTSLSSHSWSKATPNTVETANSEQTPSESVTSEDDDDLKVTRLQEEIAAAERSRLDRMTRNGALQNFPFDYSEPVTNPSSLSTPTNGGEESPFFQDALGETVIEFDGLKRELEVEQRSSQGDLNRRSTRNQTADEKKGQKYGQAGFLVSEQLLKDLKNTKSRGKRKLRRPVGGEVGVRSQESQLSELTSSSAMDQGSESSVSDMPYAHIDMKQLDHQIKNIMMETIPVVKEHINDICSPQLLGYFKRLILSLTNQMSNQEFARFFQHQLASILDDTLQKYEGRKMRDCGEDLLVEISDVLFNELAFFRLMQDLDDPSVVRKIKSAEWPSGASKDENSSEYAASSSTSGGFDEDNNDEDVGNDKMLENNSTHRQLRITESEQEELGRDRDDEMASETGIRDAEEKDDDDSEQPYTIELAPSETKPFTRIGSDEDDDERDEEQSIEDPSETAVSRDSLLEINGLSQHSAPLSTRPETEGAQGDGAEKQDLEKPVTPRKTEQTTVVKLQGDGDISEVPPTNMSAVVVETLQMNGSVNGDNNNGSDEELTINDLPQTLNVPPATSVCTANSSTLELGSKHEEENTE